MKYDFYKVLLLVSKSFLFKATILFLCYFNLVCNILLQYIYVWLPGDHIAVSKFWSTNRLYTYRWCFDQAFV